MRRFYLEREHDVSGVSGLGRVAEGVLFSDGRVSMRWMSKRSGIVIHKSLEDVVAIHGHGGASELVFVDAEGSSATFLEEV
ncbi:MAG: hypothetical protein HC933_16070 [Pleurocapsa sp. SU_196_0]|nr:hypothetical protein [Pleurocapsa sp. SU_196_0]